MCDKGVVLSELGQGGWPTKASRREQAMEEMKWPLRGIEIKRTAIFLVILFFKLKLC